ncbi:MAG: hypothetical protein FGM58_10195, partial [Acidimicrobiia bacterium]|nr:hypothetical protein [Acidimicrobiia bacterium]
MHGSPIARSVRVGTRWIRDATYRRWMRQSARPASLDRRQRTSLQRPDSGAEATPGLSTRFADVLARTLPAGAPVALLDSPWHGNPGDAAIWKGEMETLAASGHRVVYVASVGTFDRRRFDRLLPADGIVLLHGGGNLGDLWPPHQAHRESLLAELDDRRVVLLPQTVHFDDRQLGHQALRRMSRHPDFTVMARDARSLECLRSAGLDAHLSEDPASVLRFDRSPPAASRSGPSVLRLLRSDREGRVTLPCTLTA